MTEVESAWDLMNSTRPCRCGHPEGEHDPDDVGTRFNVGCLVGHGLDCGCRRFRLKADPPAPLPVETKDKP